MHESLKTALLLAGSCLMALLLAELATRVFVPVDPSAFELDDRVIFRFKPDTWTWFRHAKINGGERILIESNSLGYRGPEPNLAPDVTRVAVYGDSFIHGAFSPLPATYASRLEAALHARGRNDVQVLNAGTSGYGPDQNSLRIEDEIERIQPSAVVLSVYTGNDFGDLMRNKIYRLEGGALALNDYSIAPETRKLFARKRELFDEGSLLNHSNLVRSVKRALSSRQELRARGDDTPSRFGEPRHTARLIKARHREYRKLVLEGDNRITIGQDGYDADVSVVPDSESAVYKKALMEAVLAHMNDFLAARGIPLLLLIIPSPVDACRGYHAQVNAEAYPDYRRSGPSEALEAMARRRGIASLNLFPPFHGETCLEFYFPRENDHWNAAGQARAAELSAEALLSLLPKRRPGQR
jgi:hypothetical protein